MFLRLLQSLLFWHQKFKFGGFGAFSNCVLKSQISSALRHGGVRRRFLPLEIRFQLFFMIILWLCGFSIGEKLLLLSDSGWWIHTNINKEGNVLQKVLGKARSGEKEKLSQEKKEVGGWHQQRQTLYYSISTKPTGQTVRKAAKSKYQRWIIQWEEIY